MLVSRGILAILMIALSGAGQALAGAPEPIHSWHPLDAATRASHDRFLAALLATGTGRDSRALVTMLDTLATAPEYPPSLVAYYRGRIDGRRFTPPRAGG